MRDERLLHLYIDDSGVRHPDHEAPQRRDGMDHFTLGGVLIRDTELPIARAAYDEFCTKWNISYPLHSTKIRGKRDAFGWMNSDPEAAKLFLNDLDTLLCSLPVLGVGCVIHRPDYNTRYAALHASRWNMCKTAYSILVERAVKYCIMNDFDLQIHFEQSGEDADRAIRQYTGEMKRIGMPFNTITSSSYDALTGHEFTRVMRDDPKKVTKQSLMVQIADLFIWPISKNGYHACRPDRGYENLHASGRIIDAVLNADLIPNMGIKYSCFDFQKEGGASLSA